MSLEEDVEDSACLGYGVGSLSGFDDRPMHKIPPISGFWLYKGGLDRFRDSECIAVQDKLKSSIAANLNDDVSVYIRGQRVEVIITKTF